MRSALLQLPWTARLRAATVDRDARLRAMVGEHFDFVWRNAVRLGVPRADADDAAQQVFLVAAGRLADIEPANERAFLFGACLRIAARHRRTLERRRESPEPVPNHLADPGCDPHQACERQRAREQLTEVLATLPIDLRSVFVLFELEEETMASIARTLGLPPGTVASRLRRARELFSEAVAALQGEGGGR
jgi:RNA polymerase sigma-70 factor, ECF subfamily